MHRRAFLVASGAAALSARAFAQDAPDLPPAELEALHRVIAGPRGLTVRVTTHGCTAKADFAHYTEPRGDVVTLAFARRRLDRCRSGDGQIDLVFSYEEVGLTPGQPVMVLNPLAR